MLHSWEAGESKRRGDQGTGLPGVPAVPCIFLRCPSVPPLGLPFSHRRGSVPRPCAGVYGRGCALHQETLEELLGLQIWPYWSSFSYSHR